MEYKLAQINAHIFQSVKRLAQNLFTSHRRTPSHANMHHFLKNKPNFKLKLKLIHKYLPRKKNKKYRSRVLEFGKVKE